MNQQELKLETPPRPGDLPGWPSARTVCRHCQEPIIYLIYTDEEQTKRRRPPTHHNGHCTVMGDLRRAETTVKQYKNKRKV